MWKESRLVVYVLSAFMVTSVLADEAAHERNGGRDAHLEDKARGEDAFEGEQRENPVPPTEASLAQGRELFRAYCVGCHGSAGEGYGSLTSSLGTFPPHLNASAAEHSPDELARAIATGRGVMPGWAAALTEREIGSLVNYLKSRAQRASSSGHGHE